MANKVINALRDEYLTDPLVHVHLDMLRYGKMAERDMFIQLVKELVKAKTYYLEQCSSNLKHSIPPIIVKDSNELRKVLG